MSKFSELITELKQLEPGQQLRKHESAVAEAAIYEGWQQDFSPHQFLTSWCQQNGVTIVSAGASDYITFLKREA